MARAGALGDAPQALVAEPFVLEVTNDRIQEVLSRHPSDCTMRYMTQMVQIVVSSPAAPAAVFALLADTGGWTGWAGFDEAELVSPATGAEPEGVGARRRFRKGRTRTREEVVAFEAPGHFGYRLLEGMPLVDYRGDVTVEPEGTGSRITWRSTFRPKWPGTGWLYRIGLQRFLRDLAGRLADHAARPAPDPART